MRVGGVRETFEKVSADRLLTFESNACRRSLTLLTVLVQSIAINHILAFADLEQPVLVLVLQLVQKPIDVLAVVLLSLVDQVVDFAVNEMLVIEQSVVNIG